LSDILSSLTLVLGGQRSGKSSYAESLIRPDQKSIYVATAQALDKEMKERVGAHKGRRGKNWKTVEEPLDLASVLLMNDKAFRPILVDSLGMWVSNLLAHDKDVEKQILALIQALENIKSPLVIVSDEVGLGIIPNNALARSFIDKLGTLNQLISDRADVVVFVTAGLPMYLKE
jgi:adenosylcobinamide kinase / adenosylcobinamide-phosphate guanylyltransferase|tara:strand:- start:1 stop:522 length:522 start_codon:yes stop_codon:yes gene_type:complete